MQSRHSYRTCTLQINPMRHESRGLAFDNRLCISLKRRAPCSACPARSWRYTAGSSAPRRVPETRNEGDWFKFHNMQQTCNKNTNRRRQTLSIAHPDLGGLHLAGHTVAAQEAAPLLQVLRERQRVGELPLHADNATPSASQSAYASVFREDTSVLHVCVLVKCHCSFGQKDNKPQHHKQRP